MIENTEKERLFIFQKYLSNCVNVKYSNFTNKELIISNLEIKKRIGFIIYGKANIIKTDANANTTIMRDLKENDIFSNLFFQDSEDEIYKVLQKSDPHEKNQTSVKKEDSFLAYLEKSS